MEFSDNNILGQYYNTSNKLKKRFLRKPNVTEACESFISLGQQCENLELPAFAGLCWMAAGRCENSLGNAPGETSCLVRSARQFLTAQEYDHNLNCPSPCTENLQAALGSYSLAMDKYGQNNPLSIGLHLEIVHFLKRIGRTQQVEYFLNKLVHITDEATDTKLHCLQLLASNFVESGDYTAALDTFTEITTLVESLPSNGTRCETLLKTEVGMVLLLLILRPAPQKLSHNLAKLLEKYTWGDKNDKTLKACGMSEKMFLLLQSLVSICQSLDTSSLISLEGEFWPLLTNEQRGLLRILVQIYS